MRVLIAPDKFKGSLSAVAVADNIARGLAQAGADPVTLPLADGGAGRVAAALASGMQSHTCTINNAQGHRHRATIALDRSSRTAVVEVANTCGLSTLANGTQIPRGQVPVSGNDSQRTTSRPTASADNQLRLRPSHPPRLAVMRCLRRRSCARRVAAGMRTTRTGMPPPEPAR